MEKLKYKVVSALVFDDVRTEANGKEILIGVYGDIVVGQFPAILPKLCFRIGVQFDQVPAVPLKADMYLLDPHGNKAVEAVLEPMANSRLMTVGIVQSPFPVGGPGFFKLMFGLNGESENVLEFEIRKPTAEEANRLL